jgi:hypothetical protein
MKTIQQQHDDHELIWIEVRWWYDWVSHWEDKEWNKYSRVWLVPLLQNELCKWGKIYTVEQTGDYDYKILSERDDLSIN